LVFFFFFFFFLKEEIVNITNGHSRNTSGLESDVTT